MIIFTLIWYQKPCPAVHRWNVPNNLISVLSHGSKVQIFSPPFEYALVESLTVTPYLIRAYQRHVYQIYKLRLWVQNLNFKWKIYVHRTKVSGLCLTCNQWLSMYLKHLVIEMYTVLLDISFTKYGSFNKTKYAADDLYFWQTWQRCTFYRLRN